jgi:uncharacterized 2Fe-2S/4Fe-4S cluster protein (DUF4445 family)
MPELTVRFGARQTTRQFDPGPSLRELLNTGDTRVRSACRGIGACGLCRVRIERGEVNPPGTPERLQFTEDELAGGVRLACQVVPLADLEVTVLNPAPATPWRPLPAEASPVRYPVDPTPPGTCPGHALAVDLGTTHLCVAMVDLLDGKRLAGRWGLNPQGIYGSDVLARLTAAHEDAAAAERLRGLVGQGIGQAILDLSLREGLPLDRVRRLLVVANTPMLCLLTGHRVADLLNPRSWMARLDCAEANLGAWNPDWHLPAGTESRLVQPLGGFIGSDLLAGLVACGLTSQARASLFIDFGTNSEMALWADDRLWVTSTAGGPAFEGVGLAYGMPADLGAVLGVAVDAAGRWRYQVEGGGPALGISGPGYIDLLALGLAEGRITELGRFTGGGKGLALPGLEELSLNRRDIDLLQRAKAAIGAGIELLCRHAGVDPGAIGRVVIGGAFGRHLDPGHAARIGLLPELPAGRIEIAGNTALAGCQVLLGSTAARAALARLREQAQLINLAAEPGFEDAFLEHLYLRPLAECAAT